MTPARYYIQRLAQAFGYSRKVQHLGAAAGEMHLLREAEAHLGSVIWREAEPIESLTDDYWNLRKRIKEREQLAERLKLAEERFKESQDGSALASIKPDSEAIQRLVEERESLMSHQKEIAQERESVIREGEEIRRLHKGLKTKLEVLIEEGNSDVEIQKSEARLAELIQRFGELKERNQVLTEQLTEGDETLDSLKEQLKTLRSQDDAQAAQSMKEVSQETKEIWAMRADMAALNRQIFRHYTVIGRHISRNVGQDPNCAKAAKPHRGMVDVMKALRRSIALNHRLAGTHAPI